MGPKNLYFEQKKWPKLPIFEEKQTKIHRNRLKPCNCLTLLRYIRLHMKIGATSMSTWSPESHWGGVDSKKKRKASVDAYFENTR